MYTAAVVLPSAFLIVTLVPEIANSVSACCINQSSAPGVALDEPSAEYSSAIACVENTSSTAALDTATHVTPDERLDEILSTTVSTVESADDVARVERVAGRVVPVS